MTTDEEGHFLRAHEFDWTIIVFGPALKKSNDPRMNLRQCKQNAKECQAMTGGIFSAQVRMSILFSMVAPKQA